MQKFTRSKGAALCVFFMMLWMYASQAVVSSGLQTAVVKGRVVDDAGTAVAGATVTVKNTTVATSTDASGTYTLTNVPLGAQTVTVSMIGYSSVEQSLTVTAGDNVLDFTIGSSADELEEVVVIGYGVAKKKQVTGSISSVTPEEFNRGVVSSPDQLLAGKVAGLTVNRSGGDPTSGSTIQLRGPS